MSQTYELVKKIWSENENKFINLFSRYQDEWEYEDKTEYVKIFCGIIENYAFPRNIKLTPTSLEIELVSCEEIMNNDDKFLIGVIQIKKQ